MYSFLFCFKCLIVLALTSFVCVPVFVCVCVLMPLADDQISVKVNESGWAWMICGERLIIWKICQTPVAKVQYISMHQPNNGFMIHGETCTGFRFSTVMV